uniref:CCR4-NOT transcription complex subunit 1 n=1 Tax=Mesocestoides corti TaxID=53468 RepID=A0A5K3FYL0_MESCO
MQWSHIQQPAPEIESQEYIPPEASDEVIRDKICFILHTVSQATAEEKSKELCGLLQESMLPWFAYYLVCERIMVQQSYFNIFASFIDDIQAKLPHGRPRVLFELIRNIKAILRNIRTDIDDTQSRSALKNLGRFLGIFTLARNKAIVHDDLNIKDLIYEAYYKGSLALFYVIPFASNVVCGALDGLAFRPRSPYTMAILKVLRELYDMRDVEDRIKGQIEILFKEFRFTLNEVPAAEYLRNPSHFENLDTQLIFFFASSAGGGGDANLPLPATANQAKEQEQQSALVASQTVEPTVHISQLALPSVSVAAYNVSAATSGAIGGTGSTSHVVSATQIMNPHQFRDVAQSVSLCSAGGLLLRYEDVDLEAVRSCINTDNLIEEITSYSQSVHCYVSCGRVASRDAAVAVSAATLLRSEPAICQLILPAIEVAANELITPLFEQCRHVTVPMVEARVRKDFALQPDPAQILRAARQMMRHLAANVSHINFHKDVSEHLVNKVTNLIWNSLITASQQEKEMVEFIVKFVLSRSIFLCIAYIEKAVAERVSREVEKNLEPDVMMRQELGPQRFLEQVTANYQNLPESMQAHPYVLQPLPPPSYEEFKQSDPGFASSTTFLSPGHIVPAQPSSQTQQQIVRRATGVLTQQPTPNTVTMRSTQHQRQQQQQLQEMALAFAGQLQLQQRQPEAQQQYLQRHSSTSATSHQRPGYPTVPRGFERSLLGFPSSTSLLSHGRIVPAQPSSHTQQQIVRRATGMLTQQPTPN